MPTDETGEDLGKIFQIHVRKRQDESFIYTKAKILDILGGTP